MYDDSLTIPDDRLEEIVDGESRFLPTPTPGRWMLLDVIQRKLDSRLAVEKYEISHAEVGLGIKRSPVLTYRIPDIAVFSACALAKEWAENGKSDNYIWTPPEFLVECLSPSNRKGPIERLRQDYESIGVPEVWFIEPFSETVTIYLLEGKSLVERQSLKEGALSSVLLPQVNVNVGDLWTAFDF